jgi:long-subunit fatty acid transport protein
MRLAGRGLLFAAVTALLPAAARAGGYDTPMLYSARHMGMGGTAIGYVDDPSALFHNPAGLGHTKVFGITGDISLLLAKVHSSPQLTALNLDSKQTVAPLFLLGAGYRLNETVTVGAGVYPIASAGATYKYVQGTSNQENRTRLVFLEASPAVSLNLPARVRLGVGYRITYVNLERYQGDPSQPQFTPPLDFKMTGFNWTGFRVGAQWTALDWLQLGAVYRHKVVTKIKNSHGIAVAQPFSNIETTFVLPSKLGLGSRVDLGPVGLAVDAEYLVNSQNKAYALKGDPVPTAENPMPQPIVPPPTSVFNWRDEVTIRAGAEYRLLRASPEGRGRLALRVGYVFDGKTTNPRWPSAFGTPPAPTHVVTAGAGWNGGRWQVNAAFARRFGSGKVLPELLAEGAASEPCAFCSSPGDYSIAINAFYLDVGYRF